MIFRKVSDCVLYRNIESPTDCQILQDDLNSLAQWENDWQMKFNVAKCHSMRMTRHPPDKHIVRAFGVSQWYQWYANIVQGFTNGTIGNTICTNGNANGTIGSPNGTIGTIGKPMVPLATNGTIGKITNGTIGRNPERSHNLTTHCINKDWNRFSPQNILE